MIKMTVSHDDCHRLVSVPKAPTGNSLDLFTALWHAGINQYPFSSVGIANRHNIHDLVGIIVAVVLYLPAEITVYRCHRYKLMAITLFHLMHYIFCQGFPRN